MKKIFKEFISLISLSISRKSIQNFNDVRNDETSLTI